MPYNKLLGMLWNCTDAMPDETCAGLGLAHRSTYARGPLQAEARRGAARQRVNRVTRASRKAAASIQGSLLPMLYT